MTIYVGADPGASNYGYSVISCTGKKSFKIKILELGMFQDTITNLTQTPVKPPKSKIRKTKPIEYIPPYKFQFPCFYDEWKNIISSYNPAKVSVERYQSRGFQASSVIEAVNMMNGILSTICYDNKVIYEGYIASSWKNSLNTYLKKINYSFEDTSLKPLDNIYLLFKSSLPAHTIDSVFINIFGALKHTDKSWSDISISDILKNLQQYHYEK